MNVPVELLRRFHEDLSFRVKHGMISRPIPTRLIRALDSPDNIVEFIQDLFSIDYKNSALTNTYKADLLSMMTQFFCFSIHDCLIKAIKSKNKDLVLSLLAVIEFLEDYYKIGILKNNLIIDAVYEFNKKDVTDKFNKLILNLNRPECVFFLGKSENNSFLKYYRGSRALFEFMNTKMDEEQKIAIIPKIAGQIIQRSDPKSKSANDVDKYQITKLFKMVSKLSWTNQLTFYNNLSEHGKKVLKSLIDNKQGKNNLSKLEFACLNKIDYLLDDSLVANDNERNFLVELLKITPEDQWEDKLLNKASYQSIFVGEDGEKFKLEIITKLAGYLANRSDKAKEYVALLRKFSPKEIPQNILKLEKDAGCLNRIVAVIESYKGTSIYKDYLSKIANKKYDITNIPSETELDKILLPKGKTSLMYLLIKYGSNVESWEYSGNNFSPFQVQNNIILNNLLDLNFLNIEKADKHVHSYFLGYKPGILGQAIKHNP